MSNAFHLPLYHWHCTSPIVLSLLCFLAALHGTMDAAQHTIIEEDGRYTGDMEGRRHLLLQCLGQPPLLTYALPSLSPHFWLK